MPRLEENKSVRAIGMLQAGLAQNVVARQTLVNLKQSQIFKRE
jgi:hypothetical protein